MNDLQKENLCLRREVEDRLIVANEAVKLKEEVEQLKARIRALGTHKSDLQTQASEKGFEPIMKLELDRVVAHDSSSIYIDW